MDCILRAITAWVTAIDDDEICSNKLLQSKTVRKFLEHEKCNSWSNFISKTFPKFANRKEERSDMAMSLFLIYVSFSQKPEYEPMKAVMCRLDESIQLVIIAFLKKFDGVKFGDVTADTVKEAAAGVSDTVLNSNISPKTPVTPGQRDIESPLQQFFHTPQRKGRKKRQLNCRICGGMERTKEIQQQLEEEESERVALADALKLSQKTNADLERKLELESKWKENLKANVEALERNLKEKDNLILSLEEKCREATTQVAILKDDLAYSQTSLKEITCQLADLEKKHDKTTKKLEQVEMKKLEIESSINEVLTRNSDLEEILAARTAELKDLRDTYLILKTEMEDPDQSRNSTSFQQGENLGDQLLADAREEIEQLKTKIENIAVEKSNIELTFKSAREEHKNAIDVIAEEKNNLSAALLEKSKAFDDLNATFDSKKVEFDNELSKAMAEVEKLSNALRLSDQRLHGANEEIEHFKSKIESIIIEKRNVEDILKSALEEHKNTIAGYETEKNDLTAALVEKTKAFDDLIATSDLKNAEFINSLSKANAEKEQLNKDLILSDQKLHVAKEENDNLKTKIESNVDEMMTLQQDLKSAHEEHINAVAVYESEKNDLTAALVEKTKAFDDLIATSDLKNAEFINSLSKANAEIEQLNNDLILSDQKLHVAKEENDNLKTKIKSNVAEMMTLQQDLKSAHEEHKNAVAVYESEKNDLTAALVEKAKAFDDLIATFDLKNAEFINSLSKANAEIEQLNNDLILSDQKLHVAKEENDNLKTKIESNVAEMMTLQQDLKSAHEEHKNAVAVYESEKNDLTAALVEKAKAFDDLIATFDLKNAEFINSLSKANAQIEKLNEDLIHSDQNLHGAKEEIYNLKTKIENINVERKTIQKTLKSAHKEHKKTISVYETEKDNLSAALLEKTKAFDDLNAMLDLKNIEYSNGLSKANAEIENLSKDLIFSEQLLHATKEEAEHFKAKIETIVAEKIKLEMTFKLAEEEYKNAKALSETEKNSLSEALLGRTKAYEDLKLTSDLKKVEFADSLSQAKAEIEKLSEDLTQSNEKIMLLNAASQKMEEDLEKKIQTLESDLTDKNNQFVREKENLRNLLEERVRENSLNKENFGKIIESLQNDNQSINAEYEKLQLNLENRVEDIKKLNELTLTLETTFEADKLLFLKEKDELTSKLALMSSDLQKKSDELVRLEQQIILLQEKLLDADQALLQKENEIKNNAISSAELKESITTLTAEKINLNAELINTSCIMNNLVEEKNKIQLERDNSFAYVNTLEQKLDQLKQDVSIFECEKKKILEECGSMQGEREELEASVSKLKDEITSMQKTITHLREEVTEKEGSVTDLQIQVNSLVSKLCVTEEKINDTIKMKEACDSENAQLNLQLKAKDGELFNINENMLMIEEKLKNTINCLEGKLELVTNELEAAGIAAAHLKSHSTEISQKLEETEVLLFNQSEEISKLQQVIENLTSELDKSRINLSERENIIRALEEKICVRDAELSKTKLELEHLECESNSLNEEVASLKSEITQANEKIAEKDEELQTTKADALKEKMILKNDNNITSQKVEELKECLREKENQIVCLAEKEKELEAEVLDYEQIKSSNQNLTMDLDSIRSAVAENERVINNQKQEIEVTKSRLEQQAVEYNREKMHLCAELELHQRESATAMRHLEAKNLALDEVKNVAMAKVNELLKSHGQLRHELEDLVANKSSENTKLDLQVREARSKCEDLTANLANALSDVSAFKCTLQQFKSEREKKNREIKEKEEVIEELKQECEHFKKAAVEQSTTVKKLLAAFSVDDKAMDTTDAVDVSETFEKVCKKLKNLLDAQKVKQNETSVIMNTLRSNIHVLQCEKLKIQEFVGSVKPCLDFWGSQPVVVLAEKLERMKSIKEAGEAVKAILESSEDCFKIEWNEVNLAEDLAKLEPNCISSKQTFMNLLKFTTELHSLAENREKCQKKIEDDYKNLEQRTLSLAEINSRLSTEILKAKTLNSDELSVQEKELTSLKTTVSCLNEKIQQLSRDYDEEKINNQELTKEIEASREVNQNALNAINIKRETEIILLNIIQVKADVDATLLSLRMQVPEMLTVISTLEGRRDQATEDIVGALNFEIHFTEQLMDILKKKISSTNLSYNKLQLIFDTMKSIQENLELIKIKKPNVDELSDSLEVVPHEKTYPIVNDLEDTYSILPHASIKLEKLDYEMNDEPRSRSAWTVSPPSKKKVAQVPTVKKEKSCSGETWVIPVGPAPAKPARKTESRSRSDSTSSNSSTRSLPSNLSTRNNSKATLPTAHSSSNISAVSIEAAVKQLKKEKEVVKRECLALKTRLTEYEEKLKNAEASHENAKAATRSKYERQLERMKAEMKQLYNQEMAKVNTEQSKKMEDLKKTNDELWKQNAAYKEHIDELRSQLWSLGDKLLQEQNIKKEREDQTNLSRQLDRLTLHPANSTISLSSNINGEATFRSGSRAQQSHFPPMPVEDEDEIFDNRCLEELKNGRSSNMQSESSANCVSRLTELQIRNSLCPPHLKSSYPAETQFVSPGMFREADFRASTLPFLASESQSLTDSSDPSMTRSLLPAEKVKKKEQTSYKRPGPPTPSKNGRLSLQGDVRLTPKRTLREQNTQDKSRGTPSRLKALFSSKSSKRESIGPADENTAPSTPRGKGLRIFHRKPFGGREF